ncbi:MAG: tRNA adenosine(34) deaminase TadA [Planctomycetota bacterium]|nr:MAG: tRNA adenosine(34) deaminase TadA [Planctomycetota bacterium]
MDKKLDEKFMRTALAEARLAAGEGEVPVGCVIAEGDRIIGRAHNQRETLNDPTAHAEIIAITQAAEALSSWRLEDTTIYVTLEPCAMCAGAIVLARIPRLVFGAADPKAGACGSLFDIVRDGRLNHRCTVDDGVLADECGALLTEFFQERREERNGN